MSLEDYVRMPQFLVHALQIIRILNVHGLTTNVMLKPAKFIMDQHFQYVIHKIINAHLMVIDVKIIKYAHNTHHKFLVFRG